MATKFTEEFLDEAMRRHKAWQHQEELRLIREIVADVQMLTRKARPLSEFLEFEAAPVVKAHAVRVGGVQ